MYKRQVRKQYLPLEGVPVVARTVRAFTGLNLFRQVIIVVPAGELELCRGVIKPYCQVNLLQLIEGGPERQDSVFNGLKAVSYTHLIKACYFRKSTGFQAIDFYLVSKPRMWIGHYNLLLSN